MRSYPLFTLLILSTLALALGYGEADASPGPDVNVSINGYLPAPPGVVVRVDAGHPYYVENERRVYMEREHPRHSRGRHHRKEKRRHEAHNFGPEGKQPGGHGH